MLGRYSSIIDQGINWSDRLRQACTCLLTLAEIAYVCGMPSNIVSLSLKCFPCSSKAFGSRSSSATLAPSSQYRLAIAAPIPPAAPEINTATFVSARDHGAISLRPVVARLGPATLIVLMQVGQEGDVDELLAKIRDEIRALKRVGV